ncbi:hypothetical protein F5Y12DRAFT_761388 [Xylaria sp. FL1777]|nr:hypothetical protein F5Y12DRAFT_761388 [Xylaria sp. FL1777]
MLGCNFLRDYIMSKIDWSNIVVVGSSALLPLLSRRRDVLMMNDEYIDSSPENYFKTISGKSDIDIFLYGLDSEEKAILLIYQLEAMVRKNQKLRPGEGLSARSKNAITFLSPKSPYRHVQVILRLYKSISEILTGIDVDCSCVAFDGRQVYSNPRGIAAIATRTNTIDLSRRGLAYEYRLWKYRGHNFEVFWDCLERSRINTMLFKLGTCKTNELKGLARLLLLEQRLHDERGKEDEYWGRRPSESISEKGESSTSVPSEYALYELPYGEDITTERFLADFRSHPDDPCLVDTIQKVIEGKESGVGKVSFIQHIPGQQMMETLGPLVKDDWTDTAYVRLEKDKILERRKNAKERRREKRKKQREERERRREEGGEREVSKE